MKSSVQRGLVWLLLAVGAPVVLAEQPVDLYKVTKLVANQQASERAEAASLAMADLLVRVTGDPNIAQTPELANYLKQAQNYVLQFGYTRADPNLKDADGNALPDYAINFSFSDTAIDKLLRRLRLPIWPANRPGVLVWLVEDTWTNGRRLANEAAVQDELKAEAQRRGLPLLFPLWDLEDQMAVGIDQLWAFNRDALRTASARYQADVIVVGRYSQTSAGEFRGVWEWLDGGNSDLLDARAQALAPLAAPMIDRLANSLAARYAIVPGRDSSARLLMRVTGVDEFSRYREILSYLEGLDALRDVSLVSISGDQMLFEIYPEADLSHLMGALNLDRKLTPLPTLVQPTGSAENPLMYQWQR